MSGENKPGGNLLSYLFGRGHSTQDGKESAYYVSSGMFRQAYEIPFFNGAWRDSIRQLNRCEGDNLCDDIALLLNEVVSSEE